MQPLTYVGEQAVYSLSQRYGVSTDAVRTLLVAVSNGGGSMAQFYHSDLGGGGQWMRGGMTMVGDMFNNGLQATVAGLCSELSNLLQTQQLFEPLPPQSSGSDFNGGGFASSGGNWWPAELGSPSSSGGQNDSRYAYFPNARRLAIQQNGQLSLYDTLDHQIGGVQQQQGGYPGTLSFSSQFGTFTVESLPRADGYREPPSQAAPTPLYNTRPPAPVSSSQASNPQSHDEILSALERLGNLHQKGVLSDEEFRNKKAELLARL